MKTKVVGKRIQVGVGLPGIHQAVGVQDQLDCRRMVDRIGAQGGRQAAHGPEASGKNQQ